MNDPVRNLVEDLVSLSDSIRSTIDRYVVGGEETHDLWSLWAEVAAVRDSLAEVQTSPQWAEFVRTHARSAEYYARRIIVRGRGDWGTLSHAETALAVMSRVSDVVAGEPVEVEEVEEPEVSWKATPPTSTEVNEIRWAAARRRLFATGPFPRSATWQRDLLDRWEREDEVGEGVEEVNPDEEEKSIKDNPTINGWDLDEEGHLIIRGARIGAYLGEIDGRQQYVLSLPRGTGHQTGPYAMRREVRK